MKNPAIDARKERLVKVEVMLEELMPVEYKKILSIIQINTGLKKETAMDYLNTIINFKGYINKAGVITKPTLA